jgi:hypothetical protein
MMRAQELADALRHLLPQYDLQLLMGRMGELPAAESEDKAREALVANAYPATFCDLYSVMAGEALRTLPSGQALPLTASLVSIPLPMSIFSTETGLSMVVTLVVLSPPTY